MKFVEEFIASNGKKDSVINAMNKFNNTPALARNLVGIYEFSKSDVESNVYNPWYEEMKKYNITSGDISVFKKYIEFQRKELPLGKTCLTVKVP